MISTEEFQTEYFQKRKKIAQIARERNIPLRQLHKQFKLWGFELNKKPSLHQLIELYVNNGKSTTEIGRMFSRDKSTVCLWLKSYGIPRRSPSEIHYKGKKISPETLKKRYIEEGKSTRQIAKEFKTEKTTILNLLRKHQISVRGDRTYRWEVKGIKIPTKEELEEDYNTLSLELIAKKYNMSVQAIKSLFEKYKLETRTRSEARRLGINSKRIVPWNTGKDTSDPKVARMVKHLNEKHIEKINEAKVKQAKTRKKLMAEGKLVVWNKGRKLSPEHIEKMRNTKKKNANTPEYKAKMREIGLKAKQRSKNTKPERLMKDLLERESLTEGLKEQYYLIFDTLGTRPDFAYPEHKIAIYCDGEYWHGGFHYINQRFENIKEGRQKDGIKRTMKKDAKQHHILWTNGWTPLRFWQHEIEKNPKSVVELIKKNIFDKEYMKKREKQRLEYIKETTQ